MEFKRVVNLCRAFEREGLAFSIDGGWGVAALAGEQTRPHSDLDLAVRFDDLPAFQRVLQIRRYSRINRPGDADWNWLFRNQAGRLVDLHGFVLDEQGNGVLGEPTDGTMYPAGALDGLDALGGFTVRCVAAAFVLKFRNGFAPRAVDHHDVAALCARLDLTRPSRFHPNAILQPGLH
jgi:lincosamide nucleotidyltransferase A/C/D/E